MIENVAMRTQTGSNQLKDMKTAKMTRFTAMKYEDGEEEYEDD